MKLLILTLLLFSALHLQAQKDTVGLKLPMVEGNVKYRGIVDDPGKDKDQLYILANQWIVQTFHDSRSVLEIQDKPTGELMGKGEFYFHIKLPGSFGLTTITYKSSFVLQIDVKDNKHRYTFSTIEIDDPSGSIYPIEKVIYMCYHGIARKANRLILEAADLQMKEFILSLNHAMLLNNSDF